MNRLDRWYDRGSRSWIVQLKDEAGNQVGDAIFVGTRSEANGVTLADFPAPAAAPVVPCISVSCPYCQGRGYVTWAYGAREEETRCTHCAGRGRIITEGGEL